MKDGCGDMSFRFSGLLGSRSKFSLPFRSPLNDQRRRQCRHRRGALLLEVILSLTILFMGMAVVGIQMRTSIIAGYENERLTQALMLAEAKLGQLDVGAINLQRDMSSDGVIEGDFGMSFPGFFYRFTIEPHDDLEDIFEVTTDILYGPPEYDREPGNIEDSKVVLTLYSFRPTPPTLNLQRDFGVTDDQMEELAAALPPDLDPAEFSPRAFADMDLATMLELMPLFLEVFGQGFGFSTEQLQQAMQMGLLDSSALSTGAESLDLGELGAGAGDDRGSRRGDGRNDPEGNRPRPRGGGRPR